MTEDVLLLFPPGVPWLFMPEAGMFQLAAQLETHGISARCRDLNVELTHDYLRRPGVMEDLERLSLKGCSVPPDSELQWLMAVADMPDGHGPTPPLDPEAFKSRLVQSRFGFAAPADPRYYLRLFDTNGPTKRDETVPPAGIAALSKSRSRFWSALVESLHAFAIRPQSSRTEDVVEFAGYRIPVLDDFYDSLQASGEFLARPALVGLSLWAYEQVGPAFRLVTRLRETWPGVPVVAGGPWCSAVASALPDNPEIFDFLDAIVIGHADLCIEELAKRAYSGTGFNDIPNVAIRRQGTVHLPLRVDKVHISETVQPSYKDARLDLYPDRCLAIRLADGCFWGRCTFCHHVFPDVTVVGPVGDDEEMVRLAIARLSDLRVRLGARYFYLCDHAVPFRRLVLFARRLLDSGLSCQWEGMARFEPDVDLEGARILAASGCTKLQIGLETTDPEGLRTLTKGLALDQAARNLDIYARAGVPVLTFMLSYPGQTRGMLNRDMGWLLNHSDCVTSFVLAGFQLGRGTYAFKHPGELGIRIMGDASRDLDARRVPFHAPDLLPEKLIRKVFLDTRAELSRKRKENVALDSTGPLSLRTSADQESLEADRGFNVVLAPLAEPDRSGRIPLGTARIAATILTGQMTFHRPLKVTIRDDLDLWSGTPETIATQIAKSCPELVAFGMYPWNQHVARRVAALLGESDEPPLVAAGGPWVSADPEGFARQNPTVDIVLEGHAEAAFLEVAGRMSWDRGIEWLSGIPGTTVRIGNELHRTPPIPLSVDTLPSPYSLGIIPPGEIMSLSMHGIGERSAGIACVARDLAWASDHGVQAVRITDRFINRRPEVLRVLEDAVKISCIPEEISISGLVDFQSTSARIISSLRRCRIRESVVILPQPLRRLKRFEGAVERLRTLGDVIVDVNLGHPGDDPESFVWTVDFLESLGVMVNCFLLTGLPDMATRFGNTSEALHFQEDGMSYLRESPTFKWEDIVDCAEYFVKCCSRKGPDSDFFTGRPAFPGRSYNYEVPMEAYREAHARHRDPLPPRRVEPRPGYRHVASDNLIESLNRTLGANLPEEALVLDEYTVVFDERIRENVWLRLSRAGDAASVLVFLRFRTADNPAMFRTDLFDVGYKPPLPDPYHDGLEALRRELLAGERCVADS